MNDKHYKFLKKLEYLTSKGEIIWDSLFTYTEANDINDSLPNYKYILWEDEWHSIDYSHSFITFSETFIALLLTERINNGSDYAAGKDNKTEYIDSNIYISKDNHSRPYMLALPNDSIKKLIEIILNIETPPNTIEDIIDDFINE